MHTIVMQNHLEKGLSAISRIITQKAQLPILANILLEADKAELLLGATNLNESIKLSIPTKVEEAGTITIPGKLLSEFVHLLPAKAVDLTLKNQSLHIACENATADIAGIAATEFPKLPESSGDTLFSLPISLLEEVVSLVTFAASKDEARPHLTGVLIKIGDGKLRLVATDGFRLSFIERELKANGGEQTFLLPAKSVEEIARLARDFSRGKDEAVAVSLLPDQNQAIAKLGLLEYSTRLIEGKFPDYQKVIPQDLETTVVVGREELLAAVRLASVFSRDSIAVIKLVVGSDVVTVSSDAKEVGSNIVQVPAQVEGNGGEIAFNPRFLLELLQTIDGDTIEMAMSGALSPAIFRKNPADSFLHVIMPVRT